MVRPVSKHPTELELEILKILWADGSGSVREVRDRLSEIRDLAFNSVMTILNIMVKKGYVSRKKEKGRYVYRAQVTQESTSRGMVRDLLDRVFDGSAASLMVNVIEAGDMDAGELEALRRLIEQKREGTEE